MPSLALRVFVRSPARPSCFHLLPLRGFAAVFSSFRTFACGFFARCPGLSLSFRAPARRVFVCSPACPPCFRLLARSPVVFSSSRPLHLCPLACRIFRLLACLSALFSSARLPSFRPLARSPAVLCPPVRHVFRSAPVVLWSSVRHAFAVFCSPFWGVGCAPAASFAIGGGRSTAKGCYCAAPRKYRLTRVKGAASLTCRDTNAESWSMPSIRNGPHAHRMDRWGPSGCTMETDGSWRCKSLRGRSCCPGWLRRRSSWHRSAEERGNAKVALRIKARSEVTDNELCEKSCHPHEITSCFIHGLCRNHLCLKSRHDRD